MNMKPGKRTTIGMKKTDGMMLDGMSRDMMTMSMLGMSPRKLLVSFGAKFGRKKNMMRTRIMNIVITPWHGVVTKQAVLPLKKLRLPSAKQQSSRINLRSSSVGYSFMTSYFQMIRSLIRMLFTLSMLG